MQVPAMIMYLRNTILKIVTLIILFWFLGLLLTAQQNNNYYPNFTSVPGLPTKLATSIFKDSKGFLWFGSENGLYRYDGYEFIAFHHDPKDSTSISGNMVWKILLEDSFGNIWIRTYSNEVNIYNPNTESFEILDIVIKDTLDFNPNGIVKAIQDKDEEIWMISNNNSGLINFNKLTGDFNILRPDPDTIESAINKISTVHEDKKGKLWVGTSGGLFIFNKDSATFTNLKFPVQEPYELSDSYISIIHEDLDENLWIVSSAGLFKYNGESGKEKFLKINNSDIQHLLNDRIIRIFNNSMDNGKSLWLITGVGINKLDISTGIVTRSNNNPNDPKSKAFGAIFGIYLDGNGMLWTGTSYAGAIVYNLNQTPFTAFNIGPFDNETFLYEATSFLEDKSGNLWVGTAYAGLLKYDDQMNLIERYKPNKENPNSISYHYVYSIFEDSDSVLWIGTAAGLEILDRKTNRFHPCIYSSNYNDIYYRINDIIEDSYGYLWIGTNRGLFYQKKKEKLNTSFQKVPEFCRNRIEIRNMVEDHSGALWFGSTGEGLFQLTPENRETMKFKNYRHDPNEISSISDDIVNAVHCDNNGILWLGTSKGLNRFDSVGKHFYSFNKENGLDVNFIYYIEDDNNGKLWLSTETGIVRFSQISDSTAQSKLLDRSDGVPFDDNYQYKFYKSEKGKLYVGGRRISGNGFYCFYPDSLKDNTHIPPIVLTEFLVNNKPFKPDSSITEIKHLQLQFDQSFFTIKFAALDFINPASNEYAYFLEGFDEDWLYSGNQRIANYTNVPPGDYVFRAKGSNNDRIWNEKGTSLRITIFPPPWKTWWAYTLYGLFVVVVFYFILRYYFKRQQLLHKLALEQVQTEKLEELDRMKSRFFTNISHEFRTPLTLIMGPLEKFRSQISGERKKDLDMVLRNTKRLQNLINQLLSLSKLESGKMKLQAAEIDIVPLVKRYSQSFESLAKQKKIEFKFKSSEEDIPVFVDKDKVEKILYNLLSNAFKFTGEGETIEVSITPFNSLPQQVQGRLSRGETSPALVSSQSGVIIKVSDSGKGIPPEKLSYVFDRFYQADDNYAKDQEGTGIGLALTKELVALHQGKITVESTLGNGTTFTVFFPLGKEHLKPEDLVEIVVQKDSYGESVNWEDTQKQFIEPHIQESLSDDDTEIENTKPLLLIVEDNDDLRSYIRSYLTDDYLITEAIDGVMGVKKAIDKIPDLIVSDVMMPKMDGYELCKKLKADERTSHIPVILLTAKAAREDKLEGLETGADDFLSKPFDSEELLVRINNLITQREKLKEKYMSWLKPEIEKEKDKVLSLDDRFLIKAQEVVKQNLSDPEFSVEFFANEMAISRVQLHRKLKALTNQSGGEFIRTLRLNKAADLLLQRTGNISETAWDVGFNDPNYFTTSFSKHFGMTPSEYLAKNSKS